MGGKLNVRVRSFPRDCADSAELTDAQLASQIKIRFPPLAAANPIIPRDKSGRLQRAGT